MNENIIIGIYPAGVVYADRRREVAKDYKRLAFLCYETLELKVEDDCPVHLERDIRASAATIQMRRGLPFARAGDTQLESTYPFDNPLNDRSRLLVQAYKNEHGSAWLGSVNLYPELKKRPIIWECPDPAGVHVYGASFVLPENDAWLRRIGEESPVVIASWGTNGAFLNRDEAVIKMFPQSYCLKMTECCDFCCRTKRQACSTGARSASLTCCWIEETPPVLKRSP